MFASEIEKEYSLALERLETAKLELSAATADYVRIVKQRECKHENLEEDKKSFALFTTKCLDCGYTEWY